MTALALLLVLFAWLAAGTDLSPTAHAAALRQAQPPARQGARTLLGRLQLLDNETARTGSYALQLAPVDPPPADSHYELWLRSDDGEELLNLGALAVEDFAIDHSGSTSETLLATYNHALISIEPDDKAGEALSQAVIFSSTLPTALISPLRQLLFASELNEKGFATGALEQTQITFMHSEFLHNSLLEADFAEARRHAEHVVNLLDGENGFLYGDLNRDGDTQNPGDGFGVRGYLVGARPLLSETVTALDATAAAGLADSGQFTVTALNASERLVDEAIEKARQIFSADTVTEALAISDQLLEYTTGLAGMSNGVNELTLQLAAYPFYGVPSAAGAARAAISTPASTRTVDAEPTRIPTPTPAAPFTPSLSGELADPEEGMLWTHPGDGAVYVYVPGGAFSMGADEGEAVSTLEQPEHRVTLEPFWLGRTEVTNAQYGRCVAAGVCAPPGNQRWQQPAAAEQPVTHVDWTQANVYAAWVGGRLPSEAEWEKACRGLDARPYPWGDEPPNDELANYNNNVGAPAPVGSYPDGASPFGLLDMSGNVWEWTSSLEQPYPYQPDDGREDPDDNGRRTLRGGSFYYTQYQLRCTTRTGSTPDTTNQHFGFRILLLPPNR